ncbi:hypothetical protein NKR23_g657 [Pleurostoma richardsiae]|uniref:Complex 1 LYR protein domain-containing protein n=1 Tax=Pleurostoma richardsiae TaxID=41990 RepID=A0AA38RW55_9PEZI|nr:hypothetical protein NKR23_g657 [Pleurostoma richardsiae]
MRLSGLQKEVLSLYRQCLRESRKKPGATRKHFEVFTRAEFEKYIHIDKRDFAAVEYLLRKGRRQLETYAAPGIKDKGSPHHHPEIKVAACDLTDDARRAEMRRTAEFACHRPLSPAFAKLRSAQRALVRRSKSTAKPTAKSHPDVASKDAIIRGNPKQGLQRKEQLPMKARRYRLSGLETETGHPDSIGPLEMAERHSQNRLAAYQAQRIPDIRLSNVRQRPYYGNVYYPKQPIATLDGTGYQKARRPRRGEILITRRPGPDDIPPLDGGSNEELPATPNQGNGKSSRSAAEKEKRYGVINPYSGPVRRSLKQQRRLSTLALIHESPSNPTLEEPASRTPSERKALHRFTTDLGRYAVAVGAEARLPAYTPTPAASQTSLNTLTDMLPYHDQFRAAGLAVTSQEQKSSSPIRGDHQPDGNSPQRPRSTSSKNVPHIHALKVPTEAHFVVQAQAYYQGITALAPRQGAASYTFG